MDGAKLKVNQALKVCLDEQITDWSTIKIQVKDTLSQYLFDQTRRRSMILPIIMKV